MAELDPECHSGAVSFGQQYPRRTGFQFLHTLTLKNLLRIMPNFVPH